MTAVECARKSGAYSRQVSDGVLDSTPLTGKKSSAGLRTTWKIKLSVANTRIKASAPIVMRAQRGAFL